VRPLHGHLPYAQLGHWHTQSTTLLHPARIGAHLTHYAASTLLSPTHQAVSMGCKLRLRAQVYRAPASLPSQVSQQPGQVLPALCAETSELFCASFPPSPLTTPPPLAIAGRSTPQSLTGEHLRVATRCISAKGYGSEAVQRGLQAPRKQWKVEPPFVP
jgi:hypothetical protein